MKKCGKYVQNNCQLCYTHAVSRLLSRFIFGSVLIYHCACHSAVGLLTPISFRFPPSKSKVFEDLSEIFLKIWWLFEVFQDKNFFLDLLTFSNQRHYSCLKASLKSTGIPWFTLHQKETAKAKTVLI